VCLVFGVPRVLWLSPFFFLILDAKRILSLPRSGLRTKERRAGGSARERGFPLRLFPGRQVERVSLFAHFFFFPQSIIPAPALQPAPGGFRSQARAVRGRGPSTAAGVPRLGCVSGPGVGLAKVRATKTRGAGGERVGRQAGRSLGGWGATRRPRRAGPIQGGRGAGGTVRRGRRGGGGGKGRDGGGRAWRQWPRVHPPAAGGVGGRAWSRVGPGERAAEAGLGVWGRERGGVCGGDGLSEKVKMDFVTVDPFTVEKNTPPPPAESTTRPPHTQTHPSND